MTIRTFLHTTGTFLAFVVLISSASAKQVAYIYGDVAAVGTIPSGAGVDPFHQMLLTDTGNRGCSMFKAMVEAEGYTIFQHYDQATTLNATFLDQFDVIVFGLHQKIWSTAEKTALDTWIRAGGGILMYSDSAAGGHFGSVGINNSTGQSAVNNVLSAYGMEVTVDQGGGTRAYTSIDNESHPLTQGDLEFEGEGVSPVAVDESTGAQVLYPFENDYKVSGSNMTINSMNVTISNPRWAAIALRSVDDGNVIAIFDRQPMWNNGEGSDIERRDNKEVLRRIVKFLGGDLVPPDNESLAQLDAALVVNPSDGKNYLELQYRQWAGGSGREGIDYTVNDFVFRIQSLTDLAGGLWKTGPGLIESVAEPTDNADGTETVTLRLLPSVSEQDRAFARLAILDGASDVLNVDAGVGVVINQTGTASLQGRVTGAGVSSTTWSKVSGPGAVTFGAATSATTTATFSAPGDYELALTSENASGQVSDLVSVLVAAPADVVRAINCGGPAYNGTNGFAYEADSLFVGGHIDSFPGNPVEGTLEDELYNTARSAHSAYNIPVGPGTYRVYLQIAETFFTESGKRVFGVTIEGVPVIEDLDLFASAPGKWVVADRTFSTTVNDGQLNIGFSASVNNSLINAIVIIRG